MLKAPEVEEGDIEDVVTKLEDSWTSFVAERLPGLTEALTPAIEELATSS